MLWFRQNPAKYLERLGSIYDLPWLLISFSYNFEKFERVLIDLHLLLSVVPPFLKTGVMSAYFRMSGTLLFFIQLLKMIRHELRLL